MNKDNCTIRPERPEEQHEVENLVREAFWIVYRPGCLEHYVLHKLRDDPDFVPELDFVMEKDGQLIGQNIFIRTVIHADDGRDVPIMTMGPIGIAPEYKRQGYGKMLLDYSLEKLERMSEQTKSESQPSVISRLKSLSEELQQSHTKTQNKSHDNYSR